MKVILFYQVQTMTTHGKQRMFGLIPILVDMMETFYLQMKILLQRALN